MKKYMLLFFVFVASILHSAEESQERVAAPNPEDSPRQVFYSMLNPGDKLSFILKAPANRGALVFRPDRPHWSMDRGDVPVTLLCNDQVKFWHFIVNDELANEAFPTIIKGNLTGSCTPSFGEVLSTALLQNVGGDDSFSYQLKLRGLFIDPPLSEVEKGEWLMLTAKELIGDEEVEVRWHSESAASGNVLFKTQDENDPIGSTLSSNVWFKSENSEVFRIFGVPSGGSDLDGGLARVDVLGEDVVSAKFIPAVSTIDAIPNIATNGILPENLSGTGAVNQVKMRLKVSGEDGTYNFALSHNNEGAVVTTPGAGGGGSYTAHTASLTNISPTSVSVTVTDGVGESEDIIITGGDLSSFASDVVTVSAQSGEFEAEASEDFVIYEFVSSITDTELYSPTHDHLLVEADNEDFDGNMFLNDDTSPLDGYADLKYDGFEGETEDFAANICDLVHPNPTTIFDFKLNDGGGVSTVGITENRTDQNIFLYSQTSLGFGMIVGSMVGTGPGPSGQELELGDMTDEVIITKGAFHTKSGDAGDSRVSADGGILNDSNLRSRILFPDPDASSAENITKTINTDYSSQRNILSLTTNPAGSSVFSGKAYAQMDVKRKIKYSCYAIALDGGVSALFQIGDTLNPSFKGVSFQDVTTLFSIDIDNKAAAVAGVTANMALGIPIGEQLYNTSTSSEITVAGEPLTYVAATGEDRIADGVSASGSGPLIGPGIDSELDKVLADIILGPNRPIIFKVQNGDNSTELPIWTYASSSAYKHTKRDFAFSMIGFEPIIPEFFGNIVNIIEVY